MEPNQYDINCTPFHPCSPPRRYSANPRRFGMKYLTLSQQLISDWKEHCAGYVTECKSGYQEATKMLTNRERKGALQEMLKLCMRELSLAEKANMTDNVQSGR